jgi:hypothetical protein
VNNYQKANTCPGMSNALLLFGRLAALCTLAPSLVSAAACRPLLEPEVLDRLAAALYGDAFSEASPLVWWGSGVGLLALCGDTRRRSGCLFLRPGSLRVVRAEPLISVIFGGASAIGSSPLNFEI